MAPPHRRKIHAAYTASDSVYGAQEANPQRARAIGTLEPKKSAPLNLTSNEALAKAYADGLYGEWYNAAVELAKSENATEKTID